MHLRGGSDFLTKGPPSPGIAGYVHHLTSYLITALHMPQMPHSPRVLVHAVDARVDAHGLRGLRVDGRGAQHGARVDEDRRHEERAREDAADLLRADLAP